MREHFHRNGEDQIACAQRPRRSKGSVRTADLLLFLLLRKGLGQGRSVLILVEMLLIAANQADDRWIAIEVTNPRPIAKLFIKAIDNSNHVN